MEQDQRMASPAAAMVPLAPPTPPPRPITTLAGVDTRSQLHQDCVA